MNEGKPNTRASLAAAAVALVSALALTSCSGFPVAPAGLPAEWVPSATPSAIPQALLDSPLGFDAAERAAVRVRPETCTHLLAGNGVVVDDHTIVTSQELLAGYESVALTLSDGTDITVASVRTSADGKLEFITTVEALPGAAPVSPIAPAMGDVVRTVAFPSWHDIWTSSGTLGAAKAVDASPPFEVFELATFGSAGVTGAGVYGRDSGLLLGVLIDAEAVSAPFVYPIDVLRGLLADPALLTDHPAATC